jgi:sigma-B regulation protein RsbU (phosphoserine phosphatase)
LLAEAARYVKALLPEPVSRGDIIVDWRFEPCADLGGDCFGYHWLDRDHFALYLIDVSGHGVSASLLAVTILNLLRSQTLKDTDFHSPGNVLSSLNRAFPMEEHNGMYFTIWYGIYHASSRRLTYSSGGHPPALLIGPDTDNRQTPTHLQTPNLFIGGLPDVQYNEGSVMFTGPSRVYVFSDGVFEIEEGENCPWGYKNFTCFAALHAQSQGSFLDELMIRVGIMRDGRSLADDFSIVEARFL